MLSPGCRVSAAPSVVTPPVQMRNVRPVNGYQLIDG